MVCTAALAIHEEVEGLIAGGDTAGAIRMLENLRHRLDGCGARPNSSDWITDCTVQRALQSLVDAVIGNLKRL